MRNMAMTFLVLAALGAATAQAADATSMVKVKTGVLPSGGLYSLYTVSCEDQSSGSVASLERGTRWCVGRGGELDCYRKPADVMEQACGASAALAASEAGRDSIDGR